MADSKITALTSISTSSDPANDPLVIVDVSDTSMAATGTTKKVTLNQLLATSPTATLASATITGALTANGGIAMANATSITSGGAVALYVDTNLLALRARATSGISFQQSGGANNLMTISNAGVFGFLDGAGGTRMTLNATGLGIGIAPDAGQQTRLSVYQTGDLTNEVAPFTVGNTAAGAMRLYAGVNNTNQYVYIGSVKSGTSYGSLILQPNGGNVGIGVTPSAKLDVGDANLYAPSITWNSACASIVRSENGQLAMGSDNASPFSFWFQCRTISNTARDVSFNPLGGNFGIGTLSPSNGKLNVTQSANADSVYLSGNSGNFLRIYGWSVDNTWNTNAASIFVGKQTSTSRSINAGGTVNASGADYAEYMTKASDFVLSKGDVAGIDANGKLTNVFADAVSFVVKSTDPSYVGNDKWGVGLEGDALEAARQLVDRIAFAGQVPVNVIGAKAGDYIVPVVDGTGIKGIAVTSPTFEQYQIAVGKVIAIDADGRARIIVKVA